MKDCDIVVVATNSSDARLISPSHVRAGAIVVSASVPSNLSVLFRDHLDNHVVFDGGYARLPAGNEIRFLGMPGDGLAFGCLSETLLTAFEGDTRSFAKGALSRGQIARTLTLAERYGFELGEFRLGNHIAWPTIAARGALHVQSE
jgi:predicted amino acid dehydrogenase